MGVPWAYGPKQFEVTGGTASLIQLNVLSRGKLLSFMLRVSDAAATGAYAVYASELAAQQATDIANAVILPGSVGIPPESYRVLSGSLVAGVADSPALQISYSNRDGSPTNSVPRLWLVMHPVGVVGEVTATVSMVIESVDFS